MKSKKSLLVSLILISAMTFASCSGNDAYDDVKISGDEVIRISIPDMASDGEPEASASEEPQTSESSSSAPETLIISQLNDRHAFGTRSDTYGFIPERYKEMLDRAMYVLVGDIGDGETIGNGLEELYQARKAMPDREELLSHTGYVIADFDGNAPTSL